MNVVKAYRAKTARGTSLAFIILIITGYIAGISAKIINNQLNYVLGVYFLNLAIVSANVFVYIRNKRLDKKSSGNKNIKIKKLEIKDIERAKEEIKLNYTNSLDELINGEKSFVENKNAVILFGGSLDKNIPVADLSREYNFNFDIYNKSCENITLPAALEYFKKNIAKMIPEGIIIHLGENDISLFQNDSAAFDNYYLTLLDEIKAVNKDCRIALISINNPAGNKNLALMNAHINAIAQTEKAVFINLENAKLWNPEATKAANEFAYAMGLKIRKPLRDVAEIFYSYAFHSMNVNAKETLVG